MNSKKATSKHTKTKITLATATKEAKIGAAPKPKKITPAKKGKDGKWDKAFMSDSKAIDYVCPNNRKSIHIGEGHFFRHNCSQIYTTKKIPKCPYCDTLTVMIDYDEEEKEKNDDTKKNKEPVQETGISGRDVIDKANKYNKAVRNTEKS